ncbi:hypothetical protein RFI_19608, partial [Reticulomyxa filosa]
MHRQYESAVLQLAPHVVWLDNLPTGMTYSKEPEKEDDDEERGYTSPTGSVLGLESVGERKMRRRSLQTAIAVTDDTILEVRQNMELKEELKRMQCKMESMEQVLDSYENSYSSSGQCIHQKQWREKMIEILTNHRSFLNQQAAIKGSLQQQLEDRSSFIRSLQTKLRQSDEHLQVYHKQINNLVRQNNQLQKRIVNMSSTIQ